MLTALHLGAQPAYAFSGLLVGLLVGLTGVGGGSLMTPLLVLLFGFSPATAVGTDLLFASVTKSVGTSIHHSGKSVDWKIVGRLALGSIPATALTLLVISHYGVASKSVTTVMSITLGIALIVSAVSLLAKDRIIAMAMRRQPDFGLTTSFGLTVAVGFLVGAVVSLSSVGAGALGTIALFFLYPRLPVVKIVGSDIAHAVPLTLLAGLGHWYLGAVDLHLLFVLLLGSIPGIILGSLAARRAPEFILRPSLSLVLTLVGLRLLAA